MHVEVVLSESIARMKPKKLQPDRRFNLVQRRRGRRHCVGWRRGCSAWLTLPSAAKLREEELQQELEKGLIQNGYGSNTYIHIRISLLITALSFHMRRPRLLQCFYRRQLRARSTQARIGLSTGSCVDILYIVYYI